MDRKTLKGEFTKKQQLPFVCPTCLTGNLRIMPSTFFKQEGLRSRKASGEDFWEPDWTTYVFSCLLNCTNDHCKEVVACSGTGDVRHIIFEDNFGQEYRDYFQPKYFEPPLKIINIPDSCPEKVTAPLEESFRMYFISPKASLNNIRIAIEQLLTQLNVKRYNVKNHKRKLLTLHDRINLLPAKYSVLKDQMIAVKWIGNAGSHSGEDVSSDNVLVTYEMVEHILQEIYDPKAIKLNSLAKKINTKKGPLKSATSLKKKRHAP
jgi:hypothetical protein